ncbi:imidazole glycerol phosphate synthase, glutamine amidotransferase [Sesbania bispinosa]|nr:imidazole glycerol phosphate synthase, glutamine amidotransferase [Sesbania bispinosa]
MAVRSRDDDVFWCRRGRARRRRLGGRKVPHWWWRDYESWRARHAVRKTRGCACVAAWPWGRRLRHGG